MLGRATITNLVALLELPAQLQEAVRVGQLTLGHAKILKGITDPARQEAVAREIIARGLSVHGAEGFVRSAQETELADGDGRAPRSSSVEKTAHVQSIEDELRKKLATRVEIRLRGKERGQIILSFETNDDFERLLEMLR